MRIVDPPVPLDLDGTRELNVEYGVTITKKTTIEHSAPMALVTYGAADNGTYTVSWFDYANKNYTMNPVQSGSEVEVDMYLGIVVTPAEGYKVEFVKVNSVTTDIIVNGIYCFKVTDKEQKVQVTFIPEEQEIKTEATVIFEQPENATLKVSYLDYNNGAAAAPQTEIQSGGKVDITAGQMWLCFVVTPQEGYELDSITINGTPAQNYGAWLYKLTEATELTVVATVKAKGAAPETPQTATVSYSQIENATVSVVSFAMGDFANLPPVANGGTVEIGKWIGVSVTPAQGYEVDTVTVNGKATSLQAGFYCYSVTEATELVVVVTVKEKAEAPTAVAVTYGAAENGTYTVSWFDYAGGSFAMNPVQSGDEVAVGMYLGIVATPATGYVIDYVKVNGQTTNVVQAGIYCFLVGTTAQEVTVAFKSETATEVAEATVNFAQPENATLKVTYLDFNNGGAAAPQTEIQTGGKVDINAGQMWLCFVVTPQEGYVLDTITINGTPAQNYGAWLYKLTEATELTVVATVKKAPAYATVNFAQPENATLKVTYLDFANGGAAAPQTEIQSGGQVDINAGQMWLCFVVTPAEGYVLDTITINGTSAVNYGAWLYQLKEATELTVVATVKAA